MNKIFLILILFSSQLVLAQCIKFKINNPNTAFSKQALNNLKKIKPQINNNLSNQTVLKKLINKNITNFTQTQGFFNAEISNSIFKSICTNININIKKNTVTKYNKIKLICNESCDFLRKTIKKLPIKKHVEFSSASYKSSLNLLTSIAREHGFRDVAYWKSKIIIDSKKNIADVYFNLNLNKKHTISKIIINNPNIIKKQLLYKIINYYPNRPISNNWLEKARVNLLNSGYFNSAHLIALTPNKPSTAVKINITPTSYATKIFGLGYDTDTKFRTLLGIKIPKINKLGHKSQLTSIIGMNESNANFRYIVPGKNPNNQTWSFISHYENYLNLRFTSTKFWANSLNYKYSSDETNNTISINSRIEKEQEGLFNKTIHAIYPEAQGFKTFNNYRFNKIFLRLRWILRSGISQTIQYNHFTQYLVGFRSTIPLTTKNKLILTLNHGKTFTNDLNNIPISLQFVTGGGQSVRGYLFNELGPGKNLTNINYEYIFKIKDPWNIGFFVDTAKINATWGNKWYKGIGINFSVQTTLVSVGLSFARAISLPNRPFRLQLAVTA